ncbi:hypothetical protein skT53_33280 [Effusibacillus dendaii]|uniref:Uncharacterized protein n=1 Tax=Effusibacillus dendaii TaxID=2743772 RepID=A0A7I8DDQ6_9BACL|nr:hypothetical protein skT53_33280 [Effusibacillus dendaii]
MSDELRNIRQSVTSKGFRFRVQYTYCNENGVQTGDSFGTPFYGILPHTADTPPHSFGKSNCLFATFNRIGIADGCAKLADLFRKATVS